MTTQWEAWQVHTDDGAASRCRPWCSDKNDSCSLLGFAIVMCLCDVELTSKRNVDSLKPCSMSNDSLYRFSQTGPMQWQLFRLGIVFLAFQGFALALDRKSWSSNNDDGTESVSWEEIFRSWAKDSQFTTEFKEWINSMRSEGGWKESSKGDSEDTRNVLEDWIEVLNDPNTMQYFNAFSDVFRSMLNDDQPSQPKVDDTKERTSSWSSWLFGNEDNSGTPGATSSKPGKPSSNDAEPTWQDYFDSWSQEDVVRHGKAYFEEVLKDEAMVRQFMQVGMAAAGMYMGGSWGSVLRQMAYWTGQNPTMGGRARVDPMTETSQDLIKLHQLWENAQKHHANLYREWMELDDRAHSLSMSDPSRRRALQKAQELREQVDEAKESKKRIERQIERLSAKMDQHRYDAPPF